MSESIQVVEVGPRDGLQNEVQPISTDVKVELCQRLKKAGVRRLEAAAFVSPRWVPQMADGLQVVQALQATAGGADHKQPAMLLSALVPNLKGLEAALQAGVQEIVVFTAASEAFANKNINCSVADSVVRFQPVVELALQHGVHVRGAISCAFGCPYQGHVPANDVVEVFKRLQGIGVQEFDVADTIGVGTALQVFQVFGALLAVGEPSQLAGHFHDTHGQALANIVAALQVGIRTFHSAVGGLGGCPYAKGATGNVATEDVVYLLNGLGVETGLNLLELAQTGQWISEQLGRPYASRAGRAVLAKYHDDQGC